MRGAASTMRGGATAIDAVRTTADTISADDIMGTDQRRAAGDVSVENDAGTALNPAGSALQGSIVHSMSTPTSNTTSQITAGKPQTTPHQTNQAITIGEADEPIGQFLQRHDLDHVTDTLVQGNVTTVGLARKLTQEEYKALGLSLGNRKRLAKALSDEGAVRGSCRDLLGSSTPTADPAPAPPQASSSWLGRFFGGDEQADPSADAPADTSKVSGAAKYV